MGIFKQAGLAAAVLALGAITAPAMAAPIAAERDVAVARVSYTDLDLSTAKGMDRLKGRLERAARAVCGMDVKASGSLLPSGQARACYVETRANFAREVAMLAANSARKG